ncbi:ABC transporter ATP-binding protein [Puniceibacterium sediminis]|uniref:Peptide/nickel transport system ATP-binding protein n=1 Tax=Puniceibacterium sediminis TaxID=1608407 RepID=A0A238VUM6_9RHOB|nr:oligopeptide/dipeptide ABC transporter ATP-binding protein [Puniceibacterium sediminis]SNR37179.1 peptide/nickel transport system ATP-binding protein [Puniceibacterium sediminis]
MSGDIILRAEGLKRSFVTRKPLFGPATVVQAVDGVDLSILKGETFAIVGESGCGKSTLARLLVRLIDPSEGSVWYDGADIAQLPPEALRALRSDLQFIFQDPFSSLNPQMTVGALIEEPLITHGIGDKDERRARVDDLLTRIGLTPAHADRYPHEFSGGQRQRVGIARALATGPKVIIGDEPVSALDVSIQAQVVNILEDLKEAFGLTLVVIAHDLAVIRHMADRVAVMYLGEIVEVAPAEGLFTAPRHPYTETLLAAIPIARVGPRRAKARIEGDLPNPTAPPPGCRFHTRCSHAQDRCKTERPTLRDLTGRQVACHFAETLDLTGLTGGDAARSPSARARFALYRAARAQEGGITASEKTDSSTKETLS